MESWEKQYKMFADLVFINPGKYYLRYLETLISDKLPWHLITVQDKILRI